MRRCWSAFGVQLGAVPGGTGAGMFPAPPGNGTALVVEMTWLHYCVLLKTRFDALPRLLKPTLLDKGESWHRTYRMTAASGVNSSSNACSRMSAGSSKEAPCRPHAARLLPLQGSGRHQVLSANAVGSSRHNSMSCLVPLRRCVSSLTALHRRRRLGEVMEGRALGRVRNNESGRAGTHPHGVEAQHQCRRRCRVAVLWVQSRRCLIISGKLQAALFVI